jgi:hypothetical protein
VIGGSALTSGYAYQEAAACRQDAVTGRRVLLNGLACDADISPSW